MIYLNNAATSLHRPRSVVAAVAEAMDHLSNAGRGSDGGRDQALTITACRRKLARLFGFSHPERVIFTLNATQALNLALFGLLQPGDGVISTDLEHNSVLRPLYALEKQGVHLSFLPTDEKGRPRWEALDGLVEANTKAIVTTHASNLTGNVVDLYRVGRLARERGLLLVVDAAQTAGAYPIDMEGMGIDLLAFTGHKSLLGPQGTGGLLVGPDVDLTPLIVGGTGVQSRLPAMPEDYPNHLEAGTLNGHGIAGLSAACDLLLEEGVAQIQAREAALVTYFREGLSDLEGLSLYGDFEGPHTGVVTINLSGLASSDLADLLQHEYGIITRAGLHCAPRMHRALGTLEQGAVRFSIGYATTRSELSETLEALHQIRKECPCA